ncbi:MAG: hypothetical protein ACR2RV_13755 [Verrucomicrobiales bacterium]
MTRFAQQNVRQVVAESAILSEAIETMSTFQHAKPRGLRRLIALIWALFANLWLTAGSLEAEEFGLFTHARVSGDDIENIDHPTSEVGDVVIPEEIEAPPVTSIR